MKSCVFYTEGSSCFLAYDVAINEFVHIHLHTMPKKSLSHLCPRLIPSIMSSDSMAVTTFNDLLLFPFIVDPLLLLPTFHTIQQPVLQNEVHCSSSNHYLPVFTTFFWIPGRRQVIKNLIMRRSRPLPLREAHCEAETRLAGANNKNSKMQSLSS